MKWDEVSGSEKITRVLQAAVQADRIAHAYLFCGADEAAIKKLAAVFAASLLCETKEPCGICAHCKKAANRSHPDLHWVDPEGKSLKIEQVRSLKRKAYLLPHEARYQVFILTDAGQLTTEGANSLLKVLEEPPPASVFILLAKNPAMLLPTVVSRCQVFSLQGGGEQSIPALNHQAVELLEVLKNNGGINDLLDRLAENEELTDFCDTLLLTLRDLLILQTTGQQSLLTQGRDEGLLQPFLSVWPAEDIREALAVLLKLQKDLQSPVNVRLALEGALRRLKEVFGNADRCGYPL
ncbi:DNA polymerase III subunit [Dethiobacter alkaliphilus]|uniref:DNA polymerase III, gamma/tau subunits n=1 Tax=Dethiobacter alkaliphilus AHT 1 TaxID=555088 RepID=C0GJA2_DETAL|nr:DNA polymerase III subunit [Dethiobacter alkaliphilus]EEG76587.1 DNA polymerase III, gamma/tau subunits [Dethiobacter alkaliphilus AHT 1]